MTDFDSQAAVVGGSLVAFAGHLPASQREDIYMVTAHAQQATRDADKVGLVGDWFDYYVNQFRFFGWDIQKPPQLKRQAADAMSQQAMLQIKSELGKDLSDSLSLALDAMRVDQQAIDLFDQTSCNGNQGCFQMIPCRAAGPDHVLLGIYHREFTLTRGASGFLWGKTEVRSSIERMVTIRFNTSLYDEHREKVKNAVLNSSLKYLKSLHI